MASIYWTKTTARRDEKHLNFGIWCDLYQRFDSNLKANLKIHVKIIMLSCINNTPVLFTKGVKQRLAKRPLKTNGRSANRRLTPSVKEATWVSYGRAAVTQWESMTTIYCDRHDDVIKWNHFPRYWPFVRGIHQAPVNSPHKGQWGGALMFSFICAWINGWVNNHEDGHFRDAIVLITTSLQCTTPRLVTVTKRLRALFVQDGDA